MTFIISRVIFETQYTVQFPINIIYCFWIVPDLVKQAVADAVRPYFQSVFKQLEEIKLQLRVQRQKQVSLGHNTSGNLPENFIFPLKEIDELLELNRIFLENTECRSNAVSLLLSIYNIKVNFFSKN